MNKKTNQWKIGWGVTSLCNMTCDFCYSKSARKKSADLPFEIHKAFLDRNQAFIDSINYGTGENTLSERWFEIVQYTNIHYPHINQALTTNGYLAVASDKQRYGHQILKALSEVDISLDYCDANRHNSSRGNLQAFDWALESIRLCKKSNIVTTIVALGTDQTLEIENLAGLLEIASKYDCFLRINIYRPVTQNGLPTLKYSILKKALFWLYENTKIVSLCDPLFSSLFLQQSRQDPSGKSSLRILPDGNISPSTYLVTEEWLNANIHDVNLSDPDLSKRLLGKRMPDQIPASCNLCVYRNECKGGALDRRYLWYQNFGENDPYCPYKNQDTPEVWKQLRDPSFVPGPSVHDGYLPTLIFSP